MHRCAPVRVEVVVGVVYASGTVQLLNEVAASMLFITVLIVTLVAGESASTFFYHVPRHLWFTLEATLTGLARGQL